MLRGLSYVLLYLKLPKSILPSRPPTELLPSFGLMAGGITFVAIVRLLFSCLLAPILTHCSECNTVNGMIHCDLDAMFLYVIAMGPTWPGEASCRSTGGLFTESLPAEAGLLDASLWFFRGLHFHCVLVWPLSLRCHLLRLFQFLV